MSYAYERRVWIALALAMNVACGGLPYVGGLPFEEGQGDAGDLDTGIRGIVAIHDAGDAAEAPTTVDSGDSDGGDPPGLDAGQSDVSTTPPVDAGSCSPWPDAGDGVVWTCGDDDAAIAQPVNIFATQYCLQVDTSSRGSIWKRNAAPAACSSSCVETLSCACLLASGNDPCGSGTVDTLEGCTNVGPGEVLVRCSGP